MLTYTDKQIETLLSLPQHLQTTYKTVLDLKGNVSADKVASITGKARAVESAYLNQLVNMKILSKHREGHVAVFADAITET
jgi:hypothetical protein